MTDRELIAKLQTDPNTALRELTGRYVPLASAIASRLLPGRSGDIEEVAADTIIAIWRAGRELNADTLRGFVITTARNLPLTAGGGCAAGRRCPSLTRTAGIRISWRIPFWAPSWRITSGPFLRRTARSSCATICCWRRRRRSAGAMA